MSVGAALPLFVAGPMLVAGFLIGVPLSRTARQAVLLTTLALNAIAAGLLLARVWGGEIVVHHLGGWDSLIAVPFVADPFAALMLLLTVTITLVVAVFGVVTKAAEEPYFCPLVLFVTCGVNGALLTADLFNLFVFIEIMLLPSYGLIILARRGEGKRMQVSATRIYVTVNLLTSTIFLVGIALVYSALGTVNLGQLAGRGDETPQALLGCVVLLAALAVKAAVVPVHGWLGRTYPHLSPTLTAMFSGLHTKVAVYAIYRLYAVLFDRHEHGWLVATIVCVSMVVGVFAALGEADSRAVLSFHIVSQIGYILLGLAIFTPAGIAAGVFYLVYHTITKTSLFLSVGAVEVGYGRHPIGQVRGLLWTEPVTAIAFLGAAASLAGLPPFAGFVGKLSLIWAAFAASHWWWGAVAIVVSVFTLMSMLKIWSGTFLGAPDPDDEREESRISLALAGPGLFLAALALALGLAAQPLLELTSTVADGLLDPAGYAAAIDGVAAGEVAS